MGFKGPFALELIPKLPKPAAAERGPGGGSRWGQEFEAPEDPKERPLVWRYAGNTGVCDSTWHTAAVLQ